MRLRPVAGGYVVIMTAVMHEVPEPPNPRTGHPNFPGTPKGHDHMADILSAKARELIARPVLASLTTLGADGSPQVTPLWIDRDGDDLLFNTAKGRVKARHIGARPPRRRLGGRP